MDSKIIKYAHENSKKRLLKFLEKVGSTSNYCKYFHFIDDENFVLEIIESGENLGDLMNKENLIKYMDLAKKYWNKKEEYFNKIEQSKC